jgi:hypothetical protein
MARRPKPVHQLTAAEFDRMFPDEEACCAYLVARRWPEASDARAVARKGPTSSAIDHGLGNATRARQTPAIAFPTLLERFLRTRTSRSATGSRSPISCLPARNWP